jgi:hypothetical protein
MAPLHLRRAPRGRARECETLDRVLDGVRAHRSQVLVLCGEAGLGKTTLLDYVEARAAGCHVARATVMESEMELSFAGLHQISAPMLDRLEQLPAPQREALEVAFGVRTGAAPDTFRVSLAALGLAAHRHARASRHHDGGALDRRRRGHAVHRAPRQGTRRRRRADLARLVKGAKEIYYPGAPHGITTTHQDQVNSDLLEFLHARAENVPRRGRRTVEVGA